MGSGERRGADCSCGSADTRTADAPHLRRCPTHICRAIHRLAAPPPTHPPPTHPHNAMPPPAIPHPLLSHLVIIMNVMPSGDPIERVKRLLLNNGVDPADLKKIDKEVKKEVSGGL